MSSNKYIGSQLIHLNSLPILNLHGLSLLPYSTGVLNHFIDITLQLWELLPYFLRQHIPKVLPRQHLHFGLHT